MTFKNPFVGPRPIQADEPFFGREREVLALLQLLQARRIGVLHSPSGAGKSSLVNAALIPRLLDADFDVWRTIRVNLDPRSIEGVPEGSNRYLLSTLMSLEEELPPARRRPIPELAGLSLSAYLSSRPRHPGCEELPIFLIFDQFEEVLTVAPLRREEKRVFFEEVGRALESPRVWALFLVREDYLAALASYRSWIPSQMANTFRLDLLGLESAREAAVGLAQSGGRNFPGVDRLIRDLSMVEIQQPDGSFVPEAGPYVEPVYLQVVCRRLWAAMPEGDDSIDETDVAAYADVSKALAGYYREAVERIAAGDFRKERAIREWIGRKLVVGGVRAQVRREMGNSGGLHNDWIAGLEENYLVRREQRAGADWFELAHDRLVRPVLSDNDVWAQENLHPLQVQAQLWEDGKRAAGLLLSAEALEDAQEWATANPGRASESEQAFLRASQELRDREAQERRQVQRFVAVVMGLLGLALMAGLGAYVLYLKADWATVQARDQAWMAASQEPGLDPMIRAEYLREVEHPGQVPHWAQAASDALRVPISTVIFRLPSTNPKTNPHARRAAFSPDGLQVLTIDEGGTIGIWKADGTGAPVLLTLTDDRPLTADQRELPVSADGTVPIVSNTADSASIVLATKSATSAALSPDGTQVVTGNSEGLVQLWTLSHPEKPLDFAGHTGRVNTVTFSPDGHQLLSASADGTVRLWPADGPVQPRLLRGHTAAIRAAAFSPDDSTAATASDDGTLRLWRRSTPPIVLTGHQGAVKTVEFSADGQRLLSVSADGTARLWPIPPGGAPRVFGTEIPVRSAIFTADGAQVITGLADGSVVRQNVDGSGTPQRIGSHDGAVLSMRLSEDGRLLTTSADQTAILWSLDTTAPPVRLRSHDGPIVGSAIAPTGDIIATVAENGALLLWKSDGSEEPYLLTDTGSLPIGFPRNRRQLVVGGPEHATMWQLSFRNGKIAKTSTEVSPPLTGRLLTADGAVTADAEGLLIWPTKRGAPLEHPMRLPAPGTFPTAAVVSSKRTSLVTGDEDGTVRIWTLPEATALQAALWGATFECPSAQNYVDRVGYNPVEAMERRATCLSRVREREGTAWEGTAW